MSKDYEQYLKHIGITDEYDKMIVLNFMNTLFNTAIEIMNKEETELTE